MFTVTMLTCRCLAATAQCLPFSIKQHAAEADENVLSFASIQSKIMLWDGARERKKRIKHKFNLGGWPTERGEKFQKGYIRTMHFIVLFD